MTNDTEHTALLVMDVQDGIIGSLPDKDSYVANVKKVVDEARRRGVLVIFVVVGFRENTPEITSRNKFFSNMKGRAAGLINARPTIAPQEGDIVVTKRRFSAFAGSDLELILRSHGMENLVLFGVATSGVVLSTTQEAADKDYTIAILSDLCADSDSEVHQVLMEKVLPRQADIITSSAWVGNLD